LWWLIARAAAAGSAVVLSTSYLDEAERAGLVLALDAGRELATGTPDEIVAAIPGTLRAVAERPAGQHGRRAWRRGGRWRVWDPPGLSAAPGEPAAPGGAALRPGLPEGDIIRPDLQDAVTVAALARELRLAGSPS
jgi:hypothetical protein